MLARVRKAFLAFSANLQIHTMSWLAFTQSVSVCIYDSNPGLVFSYLNNMTIVLWLNWFDSSFIAKLETWSNFIFTGHDTALWPFHKTLLILLWDVSKMTAFFVGSLFICWFICVSYPVHLFQLLCRKRAVPTCYVAYIISALYPFLPGAWMLVS